jgi:hypothetical protein
MMVIYEVKHLNRIIVFLSLVIATSVFSKKMADIEGKEFSINLKREKRNTIKILEYNNYSVYYIK